MLINIDQELDTRVAIIQLSVGLNIMTRCIITTAIISNKLYCRAKTVHIKCEQLPSLALQEKGMVVRLLEV